MNYNLLHTINLQQQASNPKNSAWVFASAGSGKTKILTDRVLRLLLANVSPNKILCLTFTKVAATEMQSRINLELSRWILSSDQDLEKKLFELTGQKANSKLIKQARALFIKTLDDEAKIKVQTIHSFCQTIIKIFPFEANVRPTFEILESNQEKLLLKLAQKQIINKALHDNSLKEIITKANSKTHENSLNQILAKLLSKKEQINALKEKYFNIDNIITEIFNNFSLKPGQDEQDLFDEFLQEINQSNNLKLANNLLETNSKNNAKIANQIKLFFTDPKLSDFNSYKNAFLTQKNTARKISGAIAKDPKINNIFSNCCEIILKFSNIFNSLKIANDTALILKLIDAILQNYTQLKNKKSLLDYNDLIFQTNKLLNNDDFADWIKLKMDGSFDHILIDESQDTNHQQWNIIKALSEDFFSGLSASNQDRSIFIVGDEKQSIYSFQGADPDISSKIFNYFKNKLGNKLKKIELNNSFRSQKNILKTVDQIFDDESRKNAISKIAPFKEHKAIKQGEGLVEIWPQIREVENEEKAEKPNHDYEWQINFNNNKPKNAAQILAQQIAQKIKLRLNQDNDLRYSDFMILLRNRTNGFDKALIKAFNQYHIPFNSISKVKFSDSLIIQDLLSVAKFSLLNNDDLNLACLLKSPIFAISEEELLEICTVKNKLQISIFEALDHFEKFTPIKERLQLLTKKSQELNSFDFFYWIIQNYQPHFIAHFGQESLAILDNFSLTTFDFCQNFSADLQKFLEFINNLNPEISLTNNQENAVRISTIHSSKGLQAKIVIIPDCCYNFNRSPNAREEIFWLNIKEDNLPIWCQKKEYDNLQLSQHRNQQIQAAKEESLRVLYVALTRAENELYIGGFGNSNDPESWYEIIKKSAKSANFIDIEQFLQKITLKNDKKAKKTEKLAQIPKINHKIANNFIKYDPINNSQIKGRLIHKIFEIIGKNYQESQDWLLKISNEIINKEQFLNDNDKNHILQNIESFLKSNQINQIFCGNIKCEIEVSGIINNKAKLARIDLLVEKENEILIIDYKSDQTLPKTIPSQYIEQLNDYKILIKNIYPKHHIKTAIFWTEFLKLQHC